MPNTRSKNELPRKLAQTEHINGFDPDLICALTVASAHSKDADDLVQLIGVLDFDEYEFCEENEIGATFQKHYKAIKHRVSLAEYERSIRWVYERVGGREGCIKLLETFAAKAPPFFELMKSGGLLDTYGKWTQR